MGSQSENGRLDWYRADTGQWHALTPTGFYVIRGGPGAWWFELVQSQGGVTVATGREWGSPQEAMGEAESRQHETPPPAR